MFLDPYMMNSVQANAFIHSSGDAPSARLTIHRKTTCESSRLGMGMSSLDATPFLSWKTGFLSLTDAPDAAHWGNLAC
jgi:hypothetical protein